MQTGKCPFHALATEENALTLSHFKNAAAGMTVRRPARCPGEIDTQTLAGIVRGEITAAQIPPLDAVRRTIAGIICRAGLVEFHKNMDGYVDEVKSQDVGAEESLIQAGQKFIAFMRNHYFMALRGCTLGMSPDDQSRISTILQLTNFPEKEADDLFQVIIQNPAITSSMIVGSVIRDGGLVGEDMYGIASTVSLDFMKRELTQIGTFEAMINTYAIQVHGAESSILYNPVSRSHFFNMPASHMLPGISSRQEVHGGCGAMRIPGMEGSGRTLIEDFFLTIAQFYARVTELK